MFKKLNQFYVMQEDRETKENLSLGDIISWTENGKRSNKFMICQIANGNINLINTKTWIANPDEFKNLNELEQHLRNIKVDENVISVLDKQDWTIYCP
jgi:hypothetical protein